MSAVMVHSQPELENVMVEFVEKSKQSVSAMQDWVDIVSRSQAQPSSADPLRVNAAPHSNAVVARILFKTDSVQSYLQGPAVNAPSPLSTSSGRWGASVTRQCLSCSIDRKCSIWSATVQILRFQSIRHLPCTEHDEPSNERARRFPSMEALESIPRGPGTRNARGTGG